MAGVLERNGYSPIECRIDPNVAEGLIHGRSPTDGYRRGWGLEFGPLVAQIDGHPLYQEARSISQGRSIVSDMRMRNLFLLICNHIDQLESQDIIEFGSYRGGSIFFFAYLLKKLYPAAKVYGLDTFEGMPQTDPTIDYHTKGNFQDVSIDEIREAAHNLGLTNLTLVQGLVEDTFPSPRFQNQKFAIAHVDLDIYQPIRHVQNVIWDYMPRGGYLVYDDATTSSCIGATQAVEELISSRNMRSEQIYPHFVFRSGLW